MFIGPGKKNAMLDTGYWMPDRTSSLPGAPRPAVAPYHRSRITRRRGFTLLEIMFAVAILAMMSLAIYRFVQSNLNAIRGSSEVSAADTYYGGLRDLLTAQWQSLVPGRAAMTGESFKLNDRQRDEIQWNCSNGPGLLTRYAPGEFVVWLRLQPENNKSDRLDLGFLRRPQDDSGIGSERASWVPLIKNISSLQIRYFDPQLNVWVDRWTDALRLPRLVKLTVGRTDSPVPWEAIIPLGRTPY
jgi:prepilin-type N-terminal cleavage/methylation domain-containing protein